jgi:high-affinity iron transporter
LERVVPEIGTFLIGLREGLEAALVVSILVAYMVKTGNRRGMAPMWAGVGAAVVLSLAFAEAMQLISVGLQFQAQEIFEGVASVVAVGLVTWMIFWMRKAARHLRGELEGRLENALTVGPLAVTAVAFIAVAREGLETVLFIRQAAQSGDPARSASGPVAGALLGIAAAVVLGYLLYRGAVRLEFKRFFTITGAALIVVAAGVLRYGIHDFQEAGVLPGGGAIAFDLSWLIPPTSWYGTVLQGTINFVAAPTWLEVGFWLAYLVPVTYLFLRGADGGPVAPKSTDAEPTAAA